MSGPAAKARGEATEGIKAVPDEGVYPDAVSFGFVRGELQGAEQAGGAGDGHGDEAEPAQEAGPLFSADSLHSHELVEDQSQGLLAVGRQLDGLSNGVDYPP